MVYFFRSVLVFCSGCGCIGFLNGCRGWSVWVGVWGEVGYGGVWLCGDIFGGSGVVSWS